METPYVLSSVQSQLADWYEIEPPCQLDAFLVSDKAVVEAIAPNAAPFNALEQLLIAQQRDCLDITLFLDEQVMRALTELGGTPPSRGQLDTLWLAVEGVSHFLHLTWHAQQQWPVSQLELELQAEIDKYLYTHQWLVEHEHAEYTAGLHALLFELTRLHDGLDEVQIERYTTANRYAAKYCRALHRNPDTLFSPQGLNELRRFYRLSRNDKLRHINQIH